MRLRGGAHCVASAGAGAIAGATAAAGAAIAAAGGCRSSTYNIYRFFIRIFWYHFVV